MLTKRIPLFNLFGFKVYLDLSWFIIAILLLWTLAAIFFPVQYPELATSTYLWMGLFGVIGLLISIVIHEFFHAIVGRYYGLPIGGITLFVFGGIAEMKDEPPSAKSEFWIAIAGPLASIGIAILCYIAYSVGLNLQWPITVVGVLNYLWQINIILVLFNLIPAFPLDGGRILRSALWKWKGQLQWATKISSSVGSGFGVVLMILGVLALFAGNPIGGIWYFLIGLFIRTIAQASYQSLLVRDSVSGEKIDQFINRQAITVPPQTKISELVNDYLLRHHHKMFPVVEGDRLLGCVSTHEVSAVSRDNWERTSVADVMRSCGEENTVRVGSDLQSMMKQLTGRPSSRLLVLDGDRLAGIANTNDILRFISIKLELAADGGESAKKPVAGFDTQRSVMDDEPGDSLKHRS